MTLMILNDANCEGASSFVDHARLVNLVPLGSSLLIPAEGE